MLLLEGVVETKAVAEERRAASAMIEKRAMMIELKMIRCDELLKRYC